MIRPGPTRSLAPSFTTRSTLYWPSTQANSCSRFDIRPNQLAGEVREEVLQTLVRLERDRYDLLSAHLRSEIASAESSRDSEMLPVLLAQYDRLSILHKRTYPPVSPYFTDSRTRSSLKKPRSFQR